MLYHLYATHTGVLKFCTQRNNPVNLQYERLLNSHETTHAFYMISRELYSP